MIERGNRTKFTRQAMIPQFSRPNLIKDTWMIFGCNVHELHPQIVFRVKVLPFNSIQPLSVHFLLSNYFFDRVFNVSVVLVCLAIIITQHIVQRGTSFAARAMCSMFWSLSSWRDKTTSLPLVSVFDRHGSYFWLVSNNICGAFLHV